MAMAMLKGQSEADLPIEAGQFPRYALITAAYNEEVYIGQTIRSVCQQSIKPQLWIIVNDGSTDGTENAVHESSKDQDFIKLVNRPRSLAPGFSSKAAAFNFGLQILLTTDETPDFIGNLDADIILGSGYFMSILQELQNDPTLGIAGGIVFTKIGGVYKTVDKTLESVGGAVQMFRKPCLEQLGGYQPLPYGGIDAAAEIRAKLQGWRVRKFPAYRAFEQRRTGSVGKSPIRAKFREGRRFYSLGYCLVFFVCRCAYRAFEPPTIVGSLAAMGGFIESALMCRPVLLEKDTVLNLRQIQLARIKGTIQSTIRNISEFPIALFRKLRN